jgi:hypothetical protein
VSATLQLPQKRTRAGQLAVLLTEIFLFFYITSGRLIAEYNRGSLSFPMEVFDSYLVSQLHICKDRKFPVVVTLLKQGNEVGFASLGAINYGTQSRSVWHQQL